MSNTSLSLTHVDIAELFGKKSPEWFRKNKRTLIDFKGFPPALPAPGHPRWSRAAVEHWFQTSGAAYRPDADCNHDANDAINATIDARIDALREDAAA